MQQTADEFENVFFEPNLDLEIVPQRCCSCLCHKNEVATHCNYCKIKVIDSIFVKMDLILSPLCEKFINFLLFFGFFF